MNEQEPTKNNAAGIIAIVLKYSIVIDNGVFNNELTILPVTKCNSVYNKSDMLVSISHR